jgi:hypothetical protein
MNLRVMETPLEDEEVDKVVRSVFNNDYVATPNVKRKILFNPSLDTPTKDKRSMCAKLIGAERTQRTLQRIHDAIEGYAGNEKITAKLVSKISGLELNNVKRKWKVFKDWVGELNAVRRSSKGIKGKVHHQHTNQPVPIVLPSGDLRAEGDPVQVDYREEQPSPAILNDDESLDLPPEHGSACEPFPIPLRKV